MLLTLKSTMSLERSWIDSENNWRIYQFRDDLSQFSNEDLWVDLYDFTPYIKGLEKRVEELEKKVQQLIKQLTAE